MAEENRADLFARAVAGAFLLCIAVSGSLWLSTRLYPLVPILSFFGPLPYPFDYLTLALLLVLLLALIVRPRAAYLKGALLVLLALLFLQDENRLWPSFLEFFFLLFALVLVRNTSEESGSSRALMLCRFVLAAAYFWSGILKFTPSFYYSTFPWFIAPIAAYLPFITPYAQTLAIVAAAAEVLFAIGLLTKRFRNLALYEATAMHLLIFFLIGPFRGDWNDSAWIWSAVTLGFLWVLFYRAPIFSWRTMLGESDRATLCVIALTIVIIGILPALNLVNAWPSALSFNIYTGNIATGEIVIGDAAQYLPPALQRYVVSDAGQTLFDINGWSAAAFNANPVPDKRVFLALLDRICSSASQNHSIALFFQQKSGWDIPPHLSTYSCPL